MLTTNPVPATSHEHHPAPFFGLKCLDTKQAKKFLTSVTDVINQSIDDSCNVSHMHSHRKGDTLLEYANGARVRILVEMPEENDVEDTVQAVTPARETLPEFIPFTEMPADDFKRFLNKIDSLSEERERSAV